MNNYSDEQVLDITERENKALEMLKELKMTPSAIISKVNMSDDTFADKVQPYLRDIKYIKQGDVFVEAIPSVDAEVNPLVEEVTNEVI